MIGPDLEGLWTEHDGPSAAVVCHPHPLYGGDMRNPVVAAMARAYTSKGYSVLRFNFPGAGNSKGLPGGEDGAVTSLAEARRFLESRGKTRVHLSGYSFGAWVCSRAATLFPDAPMVWVAPPVGLPELLSFDGLLRAPGLRGVVAGEKDSFAPVALLGEMAARWNPDAPVRVVEGADHFFMSRMRGLMEALLDIIPEP